MKLFTAIEVPEDAHDALEALQGDLALARWVEPESFHITLRYIGEVSPPLAEDIDDALSTIASRPFALTLSSVGTFGDPVRVLWAGVHPSPSLQHLVEKVDSVLTRLRVPFDRRRHAPHVTLARFRDPPHPRELAAYQVRHNAFAWGPLPVSHFTLFSSTRTHTGSHYTPERHYIF